MRPELSTLTTDIGTVTQDVAGKAIGQAAAKANGEIDQVNANVTQAYSIANGMATGSCAGDGPGRPPVPIGHIPSN